MVRKPIIDIKVEAQKQSPFTTMAQNETAMNLYSAGFFNPEMAQQALICLDMMDFEGKESVMEHVKQGQTLFNQVQMLNQQIMGVTQALAVAGINPAQFGLQPIMPNGAPATMDMGINNPLVQAHESARKTANKEYDLK